MVWLIDESPQSFLKECLFPCYILLTNSQRVYLVILSSYGRHLWLHSFVLSRSIQIVRTVTTIPTSRRTTSLSSARTSSSVPGLFIHILRFSSPTLSGLCHTPWVLVTSPSDSSSDSLLHSSFIPRCHSSISWRIHSVSSLLRTSDSFCWLIPSTSDSLDFPTKVITVTSSSVGFTVRLVCPLFFPLSPNVLLGLYSEIKIHYKTC